MEQTQRPRVHWAIAAAPYITTALLAAALTLSVVQSVVRSNWVDEGLEVLLRIALGGLVVGMIFSVLRWLPGFLAHVLSGVLGIVWVVSRIGPLLDPALETWRDQATELLIRAIILVRITVDGGQGDDLLLFITVLGLLSYVLAYATVWLLVRRGWAWWVVLLNASVLLVNLTYASPKPPSAYFFTFVGAALLILIHQTFRDRVQTWEAALLEYPDLLAWRVVASGALVVVGLMLLTTLMPTRMTSAQVANVWQRVREPWQNVQARWDQAFSTINAPAGAVGGGFAQRGLTLSGARSLGTGLVMEVASPRYDYWRATAYDRYDGNLTWQNTTGDLARAALGLGTSQEARTPLAAMTGMPLLDTMARKLVTQTFTLRQDIALRTLFAATQPISASVPMLVEHTYLPASAGSVPNFSDTAYLASQRPLRAGTSYTVASLVTVADKSSLRLAPTTYASWVRRYLQLPTSVSQRVRDEARRVTQSAGAQNPYDKAEAIQAYLRTLPYDEQIPAPPRDRDGVEYFLFELKRGYCDYFAAAMVVLLRTEGVPTRLVSGYAGGVFNPETSRYEVRQNVAHSWPEVYFPGYGWQRFEPTPASYTAVPERPETPAEQDTGAGGDAAGLAGRQSNGAMSEEDILELERRLQMEGRGMMDAAAIQEAIRQREAQERRRSWMQRGAMGAFLGSLLLLVLAFRRRVAQYGPAGRVYEQVLWLAQWAGIRPRSSATPFEVATQLGERLPRQREPLAAVAAAYTRERYAGPDELVAYTEVQAAWYDIRWPLVGALFSRLFGVRLRRGDSKRRS